MEEVSKILLTIAQFGYLFLGIPLIITWRAGVKHHACTVEDDSGIPAILGVMWVVLYVANVIDLIHTFLLTK